MRDTKRCDLKQLELLEPFIKNRQHLLGMRLAVDAEKVILQRSPILVSIVDSVITDALRRRWLRKGT